MGERVPMYKLVHCLFEDQNRRVRGPKWGLGGLAGGLINFSDF
jgi:hypothetical protein